MVDGINGNNFNITQEPVKGQNLKIDVCYNPDLAKIGKILGSGEPEPKGKINMAPAMIAAEPQQIVDKDGVVRKGFLVTTQPRTLAEMLKGEPAKPLATVKQAQVTQFLNSIKALGLDIKPEDIMSSNGTLNPNFKVDDNGNIIFRNLKDYINGKSPEYFETQKGGWARAVDKPSYPNIVGGGELDLPSGWTLKREKPIDINGPVLKPADNLIKEYLKDNGFGKISE